MEELFALGWRDGVTRDAVGVGDITGQVADVQTADLGEVEEAVPFGLLLLKTHCVADGVKHLHLAEAVLAEHVQIQCLESSVESVPALRTLLSKILRIGRARDQ